jgi:hypothetical protein
MDAMEFHVHIAVHSASFARPHERRSSERESLTSTFHGYFFSFFFRGKLPKAFRGHHNALCSLAVLYVVMYISLNYELKNLKYQQL